MNVSELKNLPNDKPVAFESVLVVRKVSVKKARNGNEFLSVELGDKSGSFGSTLFSDNAAYEAVRNAREGMVVKVRGRTDYYQDRFSPKVEELGFVPEDEIVNHLENLVESSPEEPEGLWGEITAAIELIKHPELQATVRHAIAEIEAEFRTSPAAVSMHHAYRHGLLEHTTRMVRVARALLPLYPEIDSDLTLAGIILHDIGKTVEYTPGLATKRSQTGILQGHIVLGYRMARRAGMMAKLDPEILERLEHIILSHQGQLEWGAAVLAATPEAVFVSLIDNLDAKMGMVQNTLRKAGPNEGFSEFLAGLGAPLLLKKPNTDQATEPVITTEETNESAGA